MKRARQPHDVNHLRQYISEEIESLDGEVLSHVVHSIPIRLVKLLQKDGGHIENEHTLQ